MNPDRAIELNEAEEDDLWLLLHSSNSSVFEAKPSDKEGKIREAKKWFDLHITGIRSAICGRTTVKKIIDRAEFGDDTAIIVGVFAILVDSMDSVTASAVAALIARRGIRNFCQS